MQSLDKTRRANGSIRSLFLHKANTLNAEYSDFIAFGKFLPLFLRSNISALTPCESAKAIFAEGEQNIQKEIGS